MPRFWILLTLGWLAMAAQAEESGEPQLSFTFRAGSFNVEDELPESTEAGVEVALAPCQVWCLPKKIELRPIFGLAGNDDDGIWGHAGLRWDVRLGSRLWLQPSLAAALYSRGRGKDLGSSFHFRSAIDVAWELPNGHRVGVGVYHLSNAGLYSRNPGEESVTISYTWHVSARD